MTADHFPTLVELSMNSMVTMRRILAGYRPKSRHKDFEAGRQAAFEEMRRMAEFIEAHDTQEGHIFRNHFVPLLHVVINVAMGVDKP